MNWKLRLQAGDSEHNSLLLVKILDASEHIRRVHSTIMPRNRGFPNFYLLRYIDLFVKSCQAGVRWTLLDRIASVRTTRFSYGP